MWSGARKERRAVGGCEREAVRREDTEQGKVVVSTEEIYIGIGIEICFQVGNAAEAQKGGQPTYKIGVNWG